jgi:hypothetical protein
MALFIYIFIFLFPSGGSIESKMVINEIMADPTPVASLPDREYIELYNAGDASVNLKNWVLELGTKQKILPDVSVAPGGYLLVTSTGGAKDLLPYGKVVELSGFTLTNSGLKLSLFNPDKLLADQVTYNPSMHKKGSEDGGFSLERIDPMRLCGQYDNWATTLSAGGGTPGAENSVRATNLDKTPPKIIAATFVDRVRTEIQLSEGVILPAVRTDIVGNIQAGVAIDSISYDQNALLLKIWFRPSTISNGLRYTLILHGLKDECGNITPDYPLKFGYYQPKKSDLLLNEVLFNPYPDGSDFVEIYNNSGHEVDLSGLFLATRDESKTLKQVYPLSVSQQYLSNGAYLAVTKSREGILLFYQSKCESCIIEMEKFPTFSDLSGAVVLLNQNLEVIDEVEYSDGMHHPYITETEGISLERISFFNPAFNKGNWHSAAKSVGFASPGYKNSAGEVADSTNQMIEVDPLVFSPNGDGINDQLNIYLKTGEPGWLLNITILNCAGKVIRKLANNQTSGSYDQLFWDGLDGDFQKVQPGIYIMQISLFSQAGKLTSQKVACVVTDHL